MSGKAVDIRKSEKLSVGVKARVADRAPDRVVVPALDIAVVVLSVGARAGESDRGAIAEGGDGEVDELAPVVRVEGTELGPSGGDVDQGEGETELSAGIPPVMPHGVRLELAGTGIFPVAPGADRNEILERLRGPRMGDSLKLLFRMPAAQPPVNRQGAHAGDRVVILGGNPE